MGHSSRRKICEMTMNDRIGEVIGAIVGGVPAFVFAAITLDHIVDTVVYTGIGALMTGFVGGAIGFYTTRFLRNRHDSKRPK